MEGFFFLKWNVDIANIKREKKKKKKETTVNRYFFSWITGVCLLFVYLSILCHAHLTLAPAKASLWSTWMKEDHIYRELNVHREDGLRRPVLWIVITSVLGILIFWKVWFSMSLEFFDSCHKRFYHFLLSHLYKMLVKKKRLYTEILAIIFFFFNHYPLNVFYFPISLGFCIRSLF